MEKIKKLFSELNKRPIAFYPIYAEITGSVNAGVLLSQLIYWATTKGFEEFYKSNEEIMSETMLTDRELRTSKAKIAPFFKTRFRHSDHRLFYEIKLEAIFDAIECLSKRQEPPDILTSSACQNDKSYIETENTTENTTERVAPAKAVRPRSSISILSNLLHGEVKELAEKYDVTDQFIRDRAEDVIDYCQAKGKTYKDYMAALRNFIKSDIRRHPQARIGSEARKKEETRLRHLNEISTHQRTPEEQKRLNEKLQEMRRNLGIKYTA